MRGYDGNAQSGDAFWRGRVELGNQWPAARLVLFSDVGSAGSREHLSVAKSLVSVGVGASFLDGLVRAISRGPCARRRGSAWSSIATLLSDGWAVSLLTAKPPNA
jgi:hypothetical protein